MMENVNVCLLSTLYEQKIVVVSICFSCLVYNAIAYRERVIVKLNLALTNEHYMREWLAGVNADFVTRGNFRLLFAIRFFSQLASTNNVNDL